LDLPTPAISTLNYLFPYLLLLFHLRQDPGPHHRILPDQSHRVATVGSCQVAPASVSTIGSCRILPNKVSNIGSCQDFPSSISDIGSCQIVYSGVYTIGSGQIVPIGVYTMIDSCQKV
jgi:hypothetical protein